MIAGCVFKIFECFFEINHQNSVYRKSNSSLKRHLENGQRCIHQLTFTTIGGKIEYFSAVKLGAKRHAFNSYFPDASPNCAAGLPVALAMPGFEAFSGNLFL